MQIKTENYSIHLSDKFSGQTAFLQNLLKNYSSIFVLVDENTLMHCYPIISQYLPEHTTIQIQSGEQQKNIDTCKYIWNILTENKAERKSVLLNLGGGVIGDMGGFVAGTFKRGFDFINIPTTLLAQVDASIGGKLGIDFNGVKNLIGLFGNPKAVIICSEFLKTLPSEQLRSGFAEILKHGLIQDAAYWKISSALSLEEIFDWNALISTSVHIKKEVVEKDPFEKGLRKILNFGHTIGHAIETWSLQNDAQPLLHGEAIAIGMICEAWLSNKLFGLSDLELENITNTIFHFYPKYALEKIPVDILLKHMQLDKKNSDGIIQYSLLESIGKANFDKQVSKENILESLNYYSGL